MTVRLSFAKTFIASALLAAGSGAAVAGPIGVDAGWYGFCFAGVGSAATAGCKNAATAGTTGNTFTFTALSSVLLKVTDAFQHGDQFDVKIGFGNFATSVVAAGGGVTADPDLAYADPLYSHGSWLLAAGNYSVDIFANTSPFIGGGGAYVEVISAPIPEPTTYALMALGLAGLAAVARRRRAD